MSHLLSLGVFSDTLYYYYASSYVLYQVQFHFILVVRLNQSAQIADYAVVHRVGDIG